jgi:aminoglycoside phosphotransferase (APT) family kinase protein
VEPFDHGKNDVYSLRVERGTDEEHVVLKIGTSTHEAAFRAEPHLLTLVAERTSIPVPRVLGTSDTGTDSLEAPFFLMEHTDGTATEQRPDELPSGVLERVCVEAGRNLGELHAAFEFEGFGPVRLDEQGEFHIARTFGGWPELLETSVKASADTLAGTRFEDLVSRFTSHAETVSERLDGEFDPVLMHHDYRLENLLLDSDAVTGGWDGGPVTRTVLDWGNPSAGDAQYELVQTAALLTDRPELPPSRQNRFRKRLYEGYEETNSLERDAAFGERRYYYRLQMLVRLLKNFEVVVAKAECDADTRANELRRSIDEWEASL